VRVFLSTPLEWKQPYINEINVFKALVNCNFFLKIIKHIFWLNIKASHSFIKIQPKRVIKVEMCKFLKFNQLYFPICKWDIYTTLALPWMTWLSTLPSTFRWEKLLGMTSLITTFFWIMCFETLASTSWVFGVG